MKMVGKGFSKTGTISLVNNYLKTLLEKEESLLSEAEKEFLGEIRLFLLHGQTTTQKQKDVTLGEKSQDFAQLPQNLILNGANRYEVLETLGEGGMAVVQKIKDHVLGREAALKKIKLPPKNSLPFEQQFKLWRLKQEAAITSILEHPNIVPLYEILQLSEGELQFTMRKIEGQTLRELFSSEDFSLNSTQKFSIFLKICDAVAYAHSKGVIHRDLKPENIMVGEFGEVYVMDWGIAKILNQFEISPKLICGSLQEWKKFKTIGGIGTLGYMAPEQEDDASSVNIQADIYSLGKILRESYTLLSPLEESKQRGKVRRLKKQPLSDQLKKELELLQLIEQKSPSEIQAIIEKATAIDLETRYQNVQELVHDIENYRSYQCISAKEYTFIELLWKWRQRHQKELALVLLVIFLSVLSVLFFYLEKQHRFNDFIKEAHQELQQAGLKETPKEIGEKIRHNLRALTAFNNALSIRVSKNIERQKYSLGTQLINQACLSKDYQLAEYIAREMNVLSILDNTQKEELLVKIQEEKNKRLTFHQERLQYWKKSLQRSLLPKDIEDNAIFEISKMSEPEILKELQQILKEGTLYYIDNTHRSVLQDRYYQVMLSGLGRLENPNTAPVLLNALEQMSLYCFTTSPSPALEYMAAIASALGKTKAKNYATPLLEIRLKFGQNGVFWNLTKSSYQQLLQYEKLEETSTTNSQISFKRGVFNVDKGNYEKAITELTFAIQQDPTFSKAYYTRGNAYLQNGEYEKAIQDYNQVIEAQPNHAEAFLNRGTAKSKAQQLSAAIKDFSQAIQWAPDLVEAFNNRGLILFQLGDYKKALQDFNHALQIKPQAETYYNRGNLMKAQNCLKQALYDYNRALLLNPKSDKLYVARGALMKENQDFAGALLDYQRAIQLNPQNHNAYLCRGIASLSNGEVNSAILDFKQAIKLAPKKFQPYLYLGKAFLQEGDLSLALDNFNKVIAIVPESALGYYYRGYLRQQQNLNYKAIQDYQKALQQDPKFNKAWYQIAMAYQQIGKLDQAINALEENVKIKNSPESLQLLLNLLLKNFLVYKQRNQLKMARKELLRFKKYAPSDHLFLKKVLKDIKQIDEKLSKNEPR